MSAPERTASNPAATEPGTSGQSSSRSIGGLSRRALFTGVSIGNFLVLLDTSILNVALPNIRSDLGVTDVLLPWASVAYTVVFAGLLLGSGAVSDRFGPFRVYLGALVGFAVVSLACGLAPTIQTLIIFRALLGVAAACMVPSSIALLASMYSDPKRRSRAIGTWAAVSSIGLLAGPLLGGLLVTAGGWRLIFLVNPPIAILAMILVRKIPHGSSSQGRPLDLPGIVLSTIALGATTLALITGGTDGWGRPLPLVALAVGLVGWVALIMAESKVAHPVLPPSMFRFGGISANIAAAGVASLVFYGMLFTLTLWYEQERGFSPLSTGLAFVPMTLPMCVLPIFTGRLTAAFGAVRLIIFGLACDVVAGAMLIGVGGSHGSVVWVLLAEVALVLASTTTIPAATAAIAVAAPAEYAGSAQGGLNAGRQAGSAMGVALLGPLTGSLAMIGILLAAISVLTLLGVVGATRSRQTQPAG